MSEKVTIFIKSLPYNGRYGFRYRANSVQSVDADEAEQLVEAGIADYHEGTKTVHNQVVETAMLNVGETVMVRAGVAVQVEPPVVENSKEEVVSEEEKTEEE